MIEDCFFAFWSPSSNWYPGGNYISKEIIANNIRKKNSLQYLNVAYTFTCICFQNDENEEIIIEDDVQQPEADHDQPQQDILNNTILQRLFDTQANLDVDELPNL